MMHIETKHPEEESGLLEEQHPREGFDDVRLNIMYEIHTDDPDDLPPAGTPISVDTIEYHLDGPQPDNVDTLDMRRRFEYLNPYTPFLDEDEFDFALWRHQRRPHTYFGLYTRAIEESCLLHRRSCVRPREKREKRRKR